MSPPGEILGNEQSIPCVVLDETGTPDYQEAPTAKKRRLNDSTSLDRYPSPEQDRSQKDEPHFVIEQPVERSGRPDEFGLDQDRSRNPDNIRPAYDEDELFCLSVAGSLKRFSVQKKALAKLKIQQILYEIEFSGPQPNGPVPVSNPRPVITETYSYGQNGQKTMPRLSRHPSPPILHVASSTGSNLDFASVGDASN